MKIRKFNEESNIINNNFTENNSLPYQNVSFMQDQDIKIIHRSGRKIYGINKEFEVVEFTTLGELKWKLKFKPNDRFPYVLFVTEEFMESMKPLIESIKQVEELTKKKVNLLFDVIRANSQEKGSGIT